MTPYFYVNGDGKPHFEERKERSKHRSMRSWLKAQLKSAYEAGRQSVLLKGKDASGHEHNGKGEGGGQFTSSGGRATSQKPSATSSDVALRQARVIASNSWAMVAQGAASSGRHDEAAAAWEKAAAYAKQAGIPDPTPLKPPVREMSTAGKEMSERINSSIDSSPGLSEDQRMTYREAIDTVAKNMPDKAHELIAEGLSEAKFYPSLMAATEGAFESAWNSIQADMPGWARWAGKLTGFSSLVKSKVKKDHLLNSVGVIASYSQGDKTVHLDGGSGDAEPRHVYAHELAHAVDHRGRFSNSPTWAAAYASDIDQPSEPLSRYARTHPSEGFAEFARAVYSGDHHPDDVAKKFPQAAAAFKEFGLWPS